MDGLLDEFQLDGGLEVGRPDRQGYRPGLWLPTPVQEKSRRPLTWLSKGETKPRRWTDGWTPPGTGEEAALLLKPALGEGGIPGATHLRPRPWYLAATIRRRIDDGGRHVIPAAGAASSPSSVPSPSRRATVLSLPTLPVSSTPPALLQCQQM